MFGAALGLRDLRRVRVVKDAEVILFSPRHDHLRVMNHMISQMAEA